MSSAYVPPSKKKLDLIKQWVSNGCIAAKKIILKRPSAEKYPNTFVVMWKSPQVAGLTPPPAHICLDVHYEGAQVEGGKAIMALGGMWAKGIPGDLKPEQDLALRPLLRAEVPDVSPDPTVLDNFGSY